MTRPTGAGCDPTSFTIDPQTLTFADLVPGVAAHHQVHVENLGHDPVTIAAEVSRTDGPLFAGPTPVEVLVTTTAGDPAVVAPGERADLDVSALLPAAADSAYAALDGTAVVRVTASARCTDAGTAGSGALAVTGAAGALTTLLLALGLVLAGVSLRRRKENR